MREIRWLRALGCIGFALALVAADAMAFYGMYSLVEWMLGFA